MRRLVFLSVGVLIVLILSPIGLLYAQTPVKKSLPPVPITYPGDTDETIKRRAQWIEGATKEGSVVWWGILSPAEGAKIAAEFNKIFPFIKVNYWRGKGEEVAAKIEAEFTGGRPISVDIALGGEPYNYPRWRNTGMIEKFTDIIPGIKSVDRRMYSKYNDWATPGNNAITPAYNSKIVSTAEAPKSWEDLLDPKWKGHIGMTPDVKVWSTLALEEGGWGIEKTEDFLRKLKQQQIIWGASHTAIITMLVAGESKILGESYVKNAFLGQAKGAPVEWSRVRPVIVTGPSLTLLKGVPHPNAAKLLLEWLFSPQGFAIYEKTTGYGAVSLASGTRLARALEGSPLVYRTEDGIIKSVEMNLEKKFAVILGVRPD